LAGIMVGGFILVVAARAVRCSGRMAKVGGFPGIRSVAGRALTWEVVGGGNFVMAARAVRCSGRGVVERGGFPGSGGMAG
jgi:hypothetical protein